MRSSQPDLAGAEVACAGGAPLTQVIGLAATVTGTMRVARALVEVGRVVDVAGLDREVGLVCARSLDLPRPDGEAMRPLLQELLAELDALAGAVDVAERGTGGDETAPENPGATGQKASTWVDPDSTA